MEVGLGPATDGKRNESVVDLAELEKKEKRRQMIENAKVPKKQKTHLGTFFWFHIFQIIP